MVHRAYVVLQDAPRAGGDAAPLRPVSDGALELQGRQYEFQGVLAGSAGARALYDASMRGVVGEVGRHFEGGCVVICGDGRTEGERLERFLGSSHGGLGYAGWAVEGLLEAAGPGVQMKFALGCLKDNDQAVNLLKNLTQGKEAPSSSSAAGARASAFSQRMTDVLRPFNLFGTAEDPYLPVASVQEFRALVNCVRKSPSFAKVSASLTLSVTVAVCDPATGREATLVLLDVTQKHFREHSVLPTLRRWRAGGADPSLPDASPLSIRSARMPDVLKIPLQRSAVLVAVAHVAGAAPPGAAAAAHEFLESLSALAAAGAGQLRSIGGDLTLTPALSTRSTAPVASRKYLDATPPAPGASVQSVQVDYAPMAPETASPGVGLGVRGLSTMSVPMTAASEVLPPHTPTPYDRAVRGTASAAAAASGEAPASIKKLREDLASMEWQQQVQELSMKLAAGEAASAAAAEGFRREIVGLHARVREKDEELARWEGRQAGVSIDRLDFERVISELKEKLYDAEQRARAAEATADAAAQQAVDAAAAENGGWDTVAKLRREVSSVYEQLSASKQRASDLDAQLEASAHAYKKDADHARHQAEQREERLREDMERGISQYRLKLVEVERAMQEAQSQLQRAGEHYEAKMAGAIEAETAAKEACRAKEAELALLKTAHEDLQARGQEQAAEITALKEALRDGREGGARALQELEHRTQLELQQRAHEHAAAAQAAAAAHRRTVEDLEAKVAQLERAAAGAAGEHAKDVQHHRDVVASQNVLLEEKDAEIARLKEALRERRHSEAERLQGEVDELQDRTRALDEKAALLKAVHELVLEEAAARHAAERREWVHRLDWERHETGARQDVAARAAEAAQRAAMHEQADAHRAAAQRAEREKRALEDAKRAAAAQAEDEKEAAVGRAEDAKRDAVQRLEAERADMAKQHSEERRQLREVAEREKELREEERLKNIETTAAREGEISQELASLKSQLAVVGADSLKYSRMCEARELELRGLRHLGGEVDEVRTRNAELERLLRESGSYAKQQDLTRELEVAKDALEGVRQRAAPTWCPEWRRLNRLGDLKVHLVTAVEQLEQTHRRLESDERTLRARESAALSENESVAGKLHDYSRRAGDLEVALTQTREEGARLRAALDVAKQTLSAVASIVAQHAAGGGAAAAAAAHPHPFGEQWAPCAEVDVWLTSSVRQLATECEQFRAGEAAKGAQVAELKDTCAQLQQEVDRVNYEVRHMTHQMLGLHGDEASPGQHPAPLPSYAATPRAGGAVSPGVSTLYAAPPLAASTRRDAPMPPDDLTPAFGAQRPHPSPGRAWAADPPPPHPPLVPSSVLAAAARTAGPSAASSIISPPAGAPTATPRGAGSLTPSMGRAGAGVFYGAPSPARSMASATR